MQSPKKFEQILDVEALVKYTGDVKLTKAVAKLMGVGPRSIWRWTKKVREDRLSAGELSSEV